MCIGRAELCSIFEPFWLKFLYMHVLKNQMLREITPPYAAGHPVFFPCCKAAVGSRTIASDLKYGMLL